MSNNQSKQTESQLSDSIMDAMTAGNHDEVARLMAAELEDQPEPQLNEQNTDDTVEEVATTVEEDSSTPVDNDSDEGEVVTEQDQQQPAASSDAAKAEAEEIDRLRRELHRYKSDAGRVPHLQRRMQELERQLKAGPAPKSEDESAGQSNDSITLPEHLRKKVSDLREIDPTMADVLEDSFKESVRMAREAAQSAESKLRKETYEKEDETFLQNEYSRLVQMIPQAPEVFKMPQWKEWKESLSPGRRALAESMYADEVADAIHAFANYMQQKQPATNAQPQAPAATQQTAQATAAAQARDRKINTAATVKSTAAQQRKPFDADAYFQEQYEKLGKEHHILK